MIASTRCSVVGFFAIVGVLLCSTRLQLAESRSVSKESVVIPAPKQVQSQQVVDIERQQVAGASSANNEQTPIYVSPFVRTARAAPQLKAATNFDHQESSHAPPNYAPRPAASSSSPTKDLKTSASYGHHQHGGYDHSGWLDMGAWTGGKGSFGWYADYPVGGKHSGYGHGRK